MMKKQPSKAQALAKLLMLAESEKEIQGLLEDIFTPSELEKAHERVKIFSCLMDGLSQRETQKKSTAAIATVTHGARFLRESAQQIRNIIASAQQMTWWQRLFWRA